MQLGLSPRGAVALLLAAGLLLSQLWFQQRSPAPGMRAPGGFADPTGDAQIVSQLDNRLLDPAECRLTWQGPAGARYDVVVENDSAMGARSG